MAGPGGVTLQLDKQLDSTCLVPLTAELHPAVQPTLLLRQGCWPHPVQFGSQGSCFSKGNASRLHLSGGQRLGGRLAPPLWASALQGPGQGDGQGSLFPRFNRTLYRPGLRRDTVSPAPGQPGKRKHVTSTAASS